MLALAHTYKVLAERAYVRAKNETCKSKKSAAPLQQWVAWKIASWAKELGVVAGRTEEEEPTGNLRF